MSYWMKSYVALGNKIKAYYERVGRCS